MRSVYTLAIIGLAASAIALPVWEAQVRNDVTEYYRRDAQSGGCSPPNCRRPVRRLLGLDDLEELD